MTTSRIYTFGPFRLDAAGPILFRGSERVVLAPRALDLLIRLVEAKGALVSRDDLLATVWAGVTVEDGSVTSHVSLLRKVLGSEGGRDYIETAPKRGYRFAGQLTEPAPDAQAPPAARGSAPMNLPRALTRFVGREPALAQVRELIGRSRLVTLTGAGGAGKTRLSLEAAGQIADRFPDGVWLVELAGLADPALLPQAIAAALGAHLDGAPPTTVVERALRGKRVLLVLDNCEHVVDVAARVADELLRVLPELHVLTSSRQALGVEGERLYRVPSLTLAADDGAAARADVLASEAGQLFVERAAAVRPDFALSDGNAAAVAQICRRLDGIPLAIELAAARLTALSVDEVARRIDDRFSLLTGGARTALPRQRTLRALVDWSHDLLSEPERAVLAALSVFAGGFSLEAAEAVCADAAGGAAGVLDAIEQLVSKSLVTAEMREGAATRYRLLETIRQYAAERLEESGQTEAVRQRHYAVFEALAAGSLVGLDGAEALEWLDRLDPEQDNLRAAFESADAYGQARLAGALRTYWDIRGYFSEGRDRLAQALAVYAERDAVRLSVLIGLGALSYRLGETPRSETLLGEAVALAQALGDEVAEGEALLWQAYNRNPQGPDTVEPLIRRALELVRPAGVGRLEAQAYMQLARCVRERGDVAAARRLFLESAEVYGAAGCVIDVTLALRFAGDCAMAELDFATARGFLDDALARDRRNGNRHEEGKVLELLAQLALEEGRPDEARRLSAESLGIFRALHDPKCGAGAALLHATVLRSVGEGAAALPHAQFAAEVYREQTFHVARARALCVMGCIHDALGDGAAARQALFEGLDEQRRGRGDAGLPDLLEMIAATHAEAAAAPQLLGAATALREVAGAPLLPSERAESERREAGVRARHAPAAFARAFAGGRAQSCDEAVRTARALRE